MPASVIIVLYLPFVFSAKGTKIYQCPEYFYLSIFLLKKEKGEQLVNW